MASTATTVANAAAVAVTRTVLGVLLGATVGVVVFVVEKSAGWLDVDTRAGAALVWALLPIYLAAGAAAVGYAGFWSGVRRAARVALVESGALRRMVERVLARARKAADARAAADTDAAAQTTGDDGEPAPRGWVGARLAALGRSMADTIVDRLAAAGAPQADTGEQVDRIAGELIDEIGVLPTVVALVLLAATFAVAPLLLS